MRNMNILVATNDGFIFPIMVMIKSIKNTKHKDVFLNVYVLHSILKRESVEDLNSLNDDEVKINYLRVNDALFENVPIYEYFSKEVYFRLIAHTLLPENMDRIMWIDGDIIVRKPLDDFYYQAFGDEILIACEDMLNGHNVELHEKFNIPQNKTYFSSGVMLYNLSQMRNKVDVTTVFQFIHTNAEKIEIVDQDVLNAMFYENVKVLNNSFQYNYFAGHLRPDNYRVRMMEIVILHFCGGWKPWKENYPYYGFEEFWEVAQNVSHGNDIFNKVKKSYMKAHKKWVKYEKTKAFIGRFIPLQFLKKILGNR